MRAKVGPEVAITGQDSIPWRTLPTDLGDVPFYVVQFDKDGTCTSPEARRRLVETSRTKTDVFVFSHGWNNDWEAATSRYDRFIKHFDPVRTALWSPPDRLFQPVLVGVFWPSAALVMPDEEAPDIAGPDPATVDLDVLDESLTAAQQQRVRELISANAGDEDLQELASIVASTLPGAWDETGQEQPPATGEELLRVWKGAFPEAAEEPQEPGGFIPDNGGPAVVADAALWDPLGLIRKGLRLATVQQMKDRAGRVGGNGVASMLRELSDDKESQARIHLIGHSYGAKVVLSALCNGPTPTRVVDSILLLQPALSAYAFTDDLEGQRGGYRNALDRVRLPIVTTWSAHDAPLTKFFHLAIRRRSDLAEAQIAGGVSRFAALGGYGPQDVAGGVEDIAMPDLEEDYPLDTAHRVIAVDGKSFIAGHGAVENDQTSWALLSQVTS